MGKIKERIYELAELVYQIMDAGATDEEVDEYVESQISPEEYEFYHAHKDIIMDMLPMMESEHEILMPRLNEDSFDEPEWLSDGSGPERDEDYGDDISDYEWSVGSALSAQLEDNDVEYNEDNLGDALRNKMEFIIQCMKDGWNPLDCAVELINDEEFMAEIAEDDFDEDEMREDMYDPQDDPQGRNLITGEMDESYIMESLSEGCNCGGKKHPVTKLPNGKRPLLIRRPSVKK